eukprot:TRINITY_DN4648_c0_g2_i2.p1 TRINITY_DN4648_c0_g2~~TRINITY_DN4648_c0_g2_i2.p1  ORF type:complete len:909 (-),score=187.32 TRINITY_DN4648_c0_g2_i2:69-2687(-)
MSRRHEEDDDTSIVITTTASKRASHHSHAADPDDAYDDHIPLLSHNNNNNTSKQQQSGGGGAKASSGGGGHGGGGAGHAHGTEMTYNAPGYTFRFGKFSISVRDIKIAFLFIGLLLGVVAFALQYEPEVDNTFGLSNAYPLTLPLIDGALSYIAVELTIPVAGLEKADHYRKLNNNNKGGGGEYYSYLDGDGDGIYMDVVLETEQKVNDDEGSNSTWVQVPDQSKHIVIVKPTPVAAHSSYPSPSSKLPLSDSSFPSSSSPSSSPSTLSPSSFPSLSSAPVSTSDDIEVDFVFETSLPLGTPVRLNFTTNSLSPIAVRLTILQHGALYKYQVLYGGLVLAGMYLLIIFEVMDRTVAAIFGSFASLAILAALGDRPNLAVITSWIEYNTLALLFGMMIIVGLSSNTGFFEWTALKAYEMSRGDIWRLVLILQIFVAPASGLLDSVTTILLLTPVIVRLCKVGNIDPVPLLITTVFICNIGGCATAVGDPHMVIIVNNKAVVRSGLDFAKVFFYLAPGVVIIFIATVYFLKFFYRVEFGLVPKLSTVSEMHLRTEIDIWRDTARVLNTTSPEERSVKEMLVSFIGKTQQQQQDQIEQPEEESIVADPNLSMNSFVLIDPFSAQARIANPISRPDDRSMAGLEELKRECKIHDMRLFIMCMAVLTVVVTMFFLENFIARWVHLPLAWVSLLGAFLLMVLADIKDIHVILHKVEWNTLIFFGALFVMIEAVSRLGLINFIGNNIATVIEGLSDNIRLPMTIILLTWFSSIAAAIVNSIPYATAMLPIIVQLSQDPRLNLPLRPMLLCLALGTGLGSNGTLLGNPSQLVMAGLAEQYGFPVGFVKFAKAGIAVLLVSTLVGTLYLLVLIWALGFGMV